MFTHTENYPQTIKTTESFFLIGVSINVNSENNI